MNPELMPRRWYEFYNAAVVGLLANGQRSNIAAVAEGVANECWARVQEVERLEDEMRAEKAAQMEVNANID